MQTLAELGYARTSLRDIAERTDFSHGLLHYYFADKDDLIYECVRLYKADCIARHDAMADRAHSAPEVRSAFADYLATTIRQDGRMHRLWYDLRVQSMFDARLRETVLTIDGWLRDMCWRIVTRYSELADREVAMDPDSTYAVLDGIFQAALFGHVTGDAEALRRLVAQVHGLMPMTLSPLPRPR